MKNIGKNTLADMVGYQDGSIVSKILIDRKSGSVTLGQGETIIMPAGKPHALKATRPFKMLLTMIRS